MPKTTDDTPPSDAEKNAINKQISQNWERMAAKIRSNITGPVQAANTSTLSSRPYQTRNIPNTPANRPITSPQVVTRPPTGLQGQEEQLQAGREGMGPVGERKGGPVGLKKGGAVKKPSWRRF